MLSHGVLVRDIDVFVALERARDDRRVCEEILDFGLSLKLMFDFFNFIDTPVNM